MIAGNILFCIRLLKNSCFFFIPSLKIKMKILHLGQVIGGLAIYIRNSIIYAEGDYEYILVHGDKDNNKPIEKNGERVKEYGISLYRNLNLWNDFKAIIQAVRIICLLYTSDAADE